MGDSRESTKAALDMHLLWMLAECFGQPSVDSNLWSLGGSHCYACYTGFCHIDHAFRVWKAEAVIHNAVKVFCF